MPLKTQMKPHSAAIAGETGCPIRRDIAWSALLLLLLVWPFPAPLHAATVVVDQAYLPPPPGRWNAGVGGEIAYHGQTFTAAKSGLLAGLQLDLSGNRSVTNAIDLVLIRNPVVGSVPVVAGRVMIPAKDVPLRSPSTDPYAVDVTSIGLQMTAGQKYGFLMSAHQPSGASSWYSLLVGSDLASDGSYVKGYHRGEQISCDGLSSPLTKRDDTDLIFRTLVRISADIPSAPTILQQPYSNTVWLADAALLSVGAVGSLPLNYQWSRDGAPILGATGPQFRLPAAHLVDLGNYTVTVSNTIGVTTSQPAYLDVRTQPLIFFPTAPVECPVGQPFTWWVSAAGKGTLRFQWFWNGTAIPSATAQTYSLAASSLSDSGLYQVEVTDDLGSIRSDTARLTVRDDSAKLRWVQPIDDASSSITVDETRASVYVLARTSSLTAFQLPDGGLKYRVPLRDTPSCQTTPLVQSTLFHASIDFSLIAAGDGALTKRWPITHGSMSSSYISPAVALSTNGLAFLPSWGLGVSALDWRQGTLLWDFLVDSRKAYVTGVAYDPSLQTVFFASRSTLYAVRENGSLRWRYDLPADPSTFEIAPALGYSNLVYFARGKHLTALNAQDGQILWSVEAPLEHTQAPVLDQSGRLFTVAGANLRAVDAFTGTLVWSQPSTTNWGDYTSSPLVLSDGSLAIGAGHYLRVVSAQDGSLEWDFLAGGFVGAFNNSLAVSADGTLLFNTDEAKLYAVRGQAPMADSLWPTWRGNAMQSGTPNLDTSRQAPALLLQPTDQQVGEGQTARFSISAIGTDPLAYQWFWNDQPVPGANQPTLVLTNAVAPQNGRYWVVITNRAGSVTSTAKSLNVTPLPYVVSTLAGNGTPGDTDGPDGTSSRLNQPNGIDVDATGLIYVSDAYNHRVRFLDDSGRAGTLGGASTPAFLDGVGSGARFNTPLGLKLGARGQILVADTENNAIRSVQSGGFHWVATLAGTGQRGHANGALDQATFDFPNDLVQDVLGNTFVTEFNNHQVRKINLTGQVTTWAGTGQVGAADGPGSAASFHAPGGIAIDRTGNLFVTDYGGHRLRQIAPDATVTTLAGSGQPGLRDGFRMEANFAAPDGICVAPDGTLFVADHDNHAIRKITPQGYVVTIAGNGTPGYVDGAGTNARFHFPSGLALAPNGDLLVTDAGNHCIRRLQLDVPPLPAPSESTGLAIELYSGVLLQGPIGTTYQIQTAPRLPATTWTTVATLTLTNSPQSWLDPMPATAARRFYRAIQFGP